MSPKLDFELSSEDRGTLLEAARRSVESAVRGEAMAPVDTGSLSGALKAPCGVFVTLTKEGGLRGCVGYPEAERTLYENVVSAARAAALEDTRFPPVAPSELDRIEIEISVLSPPEEVSSPDEIEIGRHGIILSKWGRRALFLPQVAPKQGWDTETALDHLSLKAGLPPGAWRSGARISVFEAIVFEEGRG
ncbi:MAG: AmmeMemoRadiSam system protein A [Candidatus Nitrospinota bacterium M3_3B_026]